jgi:hypothetical protein
VKLCSISIWSVILMDLQRYCVLWSPALRLSLATCSRSRF